MANSKNIRNIAFVGHSSTGKTSIGEAILYNVGITTRLNRVDDKNSILDFTDEEIKRTATVGLKVATFDWKDKTINMIDTPGFADFFGEVVCASKITENFGIVIDASSGVELGTEKAWDLVQKEKLSAMFIINKMKKEEIDYENIFNDIKNSLTEKASLIQLPLGNNLEFKGIINLLNGKASEYADGKSKEIEVPADIKDKVEAMKNELIEMIAQSDDELMEKFFAESLTDEDIKKGFNKAILSGELYPVIFTDAYENIGIEHLLDIINNYMVSPADFNEIKALKNEEEITIKTDDKFSGFVFKTAVEKHIGDMAYIRVFSGTLTNMEVYNPNKNISEKVNQIYKIIGKNREDIKEVPAGGICALVKLKNTKTNDTLCDKSLNIVFPKITFPKANVSMAIIPQAKGDEEKISNGLTKLSEEDPSFSFNFDSEIKQTLIHGLGTIHLEVIMNKLKDKFGVNVNLERPRIKYRETITKSASAEGKHKKQSGGRGQFGVCNVKFEPLPRGSGFEFVDKIFGGAIPAKFVPSVEKGIKEQLSKGVLAGYPIVDVRAILYDGKYHPVDSSDIAFQIAGQLAVKSAVMQANPVLLEPIMRVEVMVPEEFMGDVMGDLNSRRGRILGMDAHGKYQKIKALVPEVEMYQYSSQLRSMTQGRGTFTMEFETYENVPSEMTEKIVEETKGLKEE